MIAREPENAIAHHHLAAARAALADWPGALQAVERAIALGQNEDYVTELHRAAQQKVAARAEG